MSSPPIEPQPEPELYELGGRLYQKLGEVWDHAAKDFRVLYKPLYRCASKPGSFEAHHLATSSFERWERKFTRVERSGGVSEGVSGGVREEVSEGVSEEVEQHVVSGEHVRALSAGNPSLPLHSRPLPAAMLRGSARVTTVVEEPGTAPPPPAPQPCRSDSGYGSRSLEPYYVMDFAAEFQQMIIEGKKTATTRVLKDGVVNGEPELLNIVKALAAQREMCVDSRSEQKGELNYVEVRAVSAGSQNGGDSPLDVFALLRVTSVETMLFSQVTPKLAAIEQFPSVDSFQACLRSFYPWIGDSDEVYVFHFEVKK